MGQIALGVTTDAADQKVPIASISSDTINTTRKHGLCSGDAVQIYGDSDDVIACGITRVTGSKTTSTTHYVIASGLTDTAFKVSTTVGGAAASLTNRSGFDGFVNPLAYGPTGTTTSGSLTDSATSITVANSALLPAAPFVAIISDTQDEVVLVTANPQGTPDHVLTVVRGFEGSLAGAHASGKQIRPRSLAPSACAMADLDAVEALIRAACGKSANDAHNGRASTLRTVTGTGDTLTTGSAHGMVAGDRFIFVSKNGGSNVRLGHTYYVTSVAGGATKIKFCAERLHSSEDPYHASATAQANITLADDITATSYIRRLTSGGGTTRLLGVKNSLYPRVWGWGSNLGSLRERPLTATLHFRAVTDRAAQNLIHHTTMCNSEDAASIKHCYQELTFKSVTAGTFTLTISDSTGTLVTTGNITFSTNDDTLATRIETAIEAASGLSGLTNLRVTKRPRIKVDGTPTHPCIKVSFGGSMRGITKATEGTADGNVVVSGASFLLIPSQRSNVLERWARLGEQIALASPAKVFFRMNFEFEKRYFAWTSKPRNGGTDGQQQAYDAWGDDASDLRNPQKPWVNQWRDMVTAIGTTGGASNARFVWCPADGFPAGPLQSSYPTGSGYVDYTGWDYYVDNPPEPVDKTHNRLRNNVNGLRVIASKPIIVCEFGFGARRSQKASTRALAIADPDTEGEIESGIDAGGDGESEPNLSPSVNAVSDRSVQFRRWIRRIYSSHASVAAAMYWDRDLGGKVDWRLESSPSLIAAFAGEILGANTRTAI